MFLSFISYCSESEYFNDMKFQAVTRLYDILLLQDAAWQWTISCGVSKNAETFYLVKITKKIKHVEKSS